MRSVLPRDVLTSVRNRVVMLTPLELMSVGVHVAHVAVTAVTTVAAMPPTLVSSSSPAVHPTHVFVRLHRRAAVAILTSQNHAATTD